MNRSIIIAALIISAAILLNGYFDRGGHAPRLSGFSEHSARKTNDKSIAVLPFQDLSSSVENAHFANDVQSEIISQLAKIQELKVVSDTSTAQYKTVPRDLGQVGKQLHVAHILEGSVQRANDRVRLNVQLVDATTQNHLWAQTYDRQVTDLFAAENEIAESIASALRVQLSPSK